MKQKLLRIIGEWPLTKNDVKLLTDQILSLLQSEIKECVGEEFFPPNYTGKVGLHENIQALAVGNNQKRKEIINKLKDKGFIN